MSGPMYNEYGDFNVHDDNMSDSNRKQNKYKIYESLTSKSNYLKLPILFKDINFKPRTKNIGLYMAGQPGTPIVNAVTGQKYPGHFVGRFHEDLYFKVMLCSGENGPNPVTLFYDSPNQYEKHFQRKVSERNQNIWYKKLEAYQQKYESSSD